VYALKLKFLKLGFQEFLGGGGSADFVPSSSQKEIYSTGMRSIARWMRRFIYNPNIWIWPDTRRI
jgi:hypothetical protein